MSQEELLNKLNELKKEIMKENAQREVKASLKNPGKFREMKKTIARILTILNSKTKKNKEVAEKK